MARIIPRFGLDSLLLIVVLVAVCCAVLRVDPFLGMWLSPLSAPALLRTILVVSRHPQGSRRTPYEDKLLSFLYSLAAMVAIWLPALYFFAMIANVLVGLLAACCWIIIAYRFFLLRARDVGL
jgi:hypothetical protein